MERRFSHAPLAQLHLSLSRLSDTQLTDELSRSVADERHSTVRVVALLDEFDRRRLYLRYGFPSLFAYCTGKLLMSEDAACRRIAVARAIRRHPDLLERLNDGRLSITTAGLLVQKLTPTRLEAVLDKAAFKSKREVEVLIAAEQPLPPVRAVIRKTPQMKPTLQTPTTCSAPSSDDARASESPTTLSELISQAVPVPRPVPPRHVVAPLSAVHYKLQVTISASARERLQEIQDLMRHRLPSGDPATIVEHALEVLHRELLKQKAADVARPGFGKSPAEAKGRHIPAAVIRAVWRRDEGRCAFASGDGKRCGSTSGVEFHHVQPFAVGGAATAAARGPIRCWRRPARRRRIGRLRRLRRVA